MLLYLVHGLQMNTVMLLYLMQGLQMNTVMLPGLQINTVMLPGLQINTVMSQYLVQPNNGAGFGVGFDATLEVDVVPLLDIVGIKSWSESYFNPRRI